jgi:hypothetical protein
MTLVLAVALFLTAAPLQSEKSKSETEVLEQLDAAPPPLKSDLPPSVRDSGSWVGFANHFALKASNISVGLASGQSLPRIILDAGLCTNSSPCLLALTYEFSHRDEPSRKRAVFRVAMRNAEGRRWEGLALHEAPGDSFRYWTSDGGPWRELQGTPETLALHGAFYDEVLAIILSHPVRTPQPKKGPVPKKKMAPTTTATPARSGH